MRHPVEERLQRLLAILAATADRGPVSLRELAERHRVTPHQLRKDLTLALDMGVPPWGLPDETPLVEVVGDRVEVSVPAHFASQPRLTRPEGFAVVAAARAALELDPSLDSLREALDVLVEALALGDDVDVDLDPPVHLDVVRRAVDRCERIEVAYWSSWRDEESRRTLDPLHVVFVDGAWILLAHDDLSGEQRRFRVDRLLEVRPTGVVFEPPPFEPVTEAFDAPDTAVEVTVRFPVTARWIVEYVDVDVLADDRTGLTATLTTVGDAWLGRLLLRTGGEVLAPPELGDLRQRAARSALARYEG